MESFSSIEEIKGTLYKLGKKYNLKIKNLDYTDITLKARLTVNKETYIQVYFNMQKDKFLLALIQNNKRIYGFDKLENDCHEHPFENPEEHINTPCGEMSIEKFILKIKHYLQEKSSW